MKRALPFAVLLVFAVTVQATPVITPMAENPQTTSLITSKPTIDAETTSQAAGLSPALQLRMGLESLLAFMNQAPKPADSAIARFLDEEIAPYFDFKHMAKAAMGRFYRGMNEQQRQEMAEEIKRLFLTRMTQRLTGYQGQQVRYLPIRTTRDGNGAVASVVILNPRSYPARIDFRLARNGDRWSIIDLAANGQSAVMYYRQVMVTRWMRKSYQQMRYQARPRHGAGYGPGYMPNPMSGYRMPNPMR